MTRTVLTIGGSDPTGGAGIQADIKTLTMLGVYGAAAITCVTVQNSHGVTAIQPLDPELVAAQIRAVLDDHHVHHVKIGMVGSTPIARAIGESLAGFEGEVIYDPVLSATTGQPLMEESGLDSLRRELLRRTTILTPNLPELARFRGRRATRCPAGGGRTPHHLELLAGSDRQGGASPGSAAYRHTFPAK